MKATKAYIVSLGTTGLLLASAVSLLLVVGAIIAFNGWPGSGIADRVEGMLVDRGERHFRVPGPVQTASNAASAAAAVATAPAPGSVAEQLLAGPGPGSGPGDGPSRPPRTVRTRPPPGGPSQPVGVALPPAEGLLPGIVPGVDSGGIKDQVSETAGNAGSQGGQVVAPVNPQLGQALTDTGNLLSQTVDSLP